MISKYDHVIAQLRDAPKTWLITGVAGFIGSNLLESLLRLDQTVIGLDNFSTGYQHNLDEVQGQVTETQWNRFSFSSGDICNLDDCHRACEGVDYVLHQAALGSVPRSINDPLTTNAVNVSGFLNMLTAARDANVKSFTYAASSSTYGDHPGLPKVEENIGKPLSPYAVTKYVNELYADVFHRCYGFSSIGLRYFNVFGPRQNPNGAYAAVIPKWVMALLAGVPVQINGDGRTSRDFSYVANAVQANILAATAEGDALNQIFNMAVGEQTSLNDLFYMICDKLRSHGLNNDVQPQYCDFREGDVRHSKADISKAETLLGFKPTHAIADGLNPATDWYVSNRHLF